MLHSGRIPVLVDNNQSAPFPVMETSAELLYLLKFADKDDKFGFTDELERSQCLQWLFFWHGSGAPYQGQTNHFNIYAKEKIPCKDFLSISAMRMSNLFSILRSERSTDPTPLIRQTPSPASKTKPSACTACSRSTCRESTRALHANTSPVRTPENIRWRILAPGHGLRDGVTPGLPTRRWRRSLIY